MTDPAIDDRQFSQAATLRDGTPVTIRAIRADDRGRIVDAFQKLERESVYTRFFSHRREIPPDMLDRVAEIDFDHVGGLVVTLGEGPAETVIGGASYFAGTTPEGTRAAEVAFTVEEDYQGQGLASKLMTLLTIIARRHGIRRFDADVLAGNAPMLSVFQRSGLPMRKRSEGGVIHLTLDLTQQAG